MAGILAASMAKLTLEQPSIPFRNAISAALRVSETCEFMEAEGDLGTAGGCACCCEASGPNGAIGAGGDGEEAQEAKENAARHWSRESVKRIG